MLRLIDWVIAEVYVFVSYRGCKIPYLYTSKMKSLGVEAAVVEGTESILWSVTDLSCLPHYYVRSRGRAYGG